VQSVKKRIGGKKALHTNGRCFLRFLRISRLLVGWHESNFYKNAFNGTQSNTFAAFIAISR